MTLSIIGAGKESNPEMEAHIHAMISVKQGHEVQIAPLLQQLTDEQNRKDHPPNGVYMQLIKVELASHCTAIDYVVCQFAFLHAMGVPGIPVPVIPSFLPEGETVQ